MNETRAVVAALLKRYREAAGLTIREVGERIGKSNQTVSAWEQGRGQPDAEMFLRLCDVYNVENVSDFFGQSAKLTPNASLSDEDRQLLDYYHSMNDDGQERLMEQAEMLSSKREYKKRSELFRFEEEFGALG
ncbi:hypothetical protein FACS18949_07690 [Clostridia bacterium]|nr:hypothetical protein FACS18949_07690 [Clostridia bacterium]